MHNMNTELITQQLDPLEVAKKLVEKGALVTDIADITGLPISKIKKLPPIDFTDEERKIRIRMAERGLKVKTIAIAIGIHPQDVTNVIRGRSRSPRYIEEVYQYLDLEMRQMG